MTGDPWQDVRCYSAFDDLDRDATRLEVDEAISLFRQDWMFPYLKIRKDAAYRKKAQQEALRMRLEDGLPYPLPPATPPAPPPPTYLKDLAPVPKPWPPMERWTLREPLV